MTKTIEVTSVPGELDAEITDSLPTLGDTVTITAPTGTFFTDSERHHLQRGRAGGAAQTETTLSFIPIPNIYGPALVSNVGVASNAAVVFGLAHAVQRQDRFDRGYRHGLSTRRRRWAPR